MYMAYGFLSLLVMLTVNVHINSDDKKLGVFFLVILGILIVAAIWMILEMKRQSKALMKIGILEFTRSSVTKTIGDLRSSCTYDNIVKIEIERHLRALSVFSSKTGSLTHIIKIVHKDMTEENFVISDISMDFGQKISILETLKTLRRSVGLHYLIKNNT
jgi:hypothetical protein